MFNHGLFQHHRLVFINLENACQVESLYSYIFIEKDQARTMINSALRGLRENEQSSDQKQDAVDLNALTNFVEKYF